MEQIFQFLNTKKLGEKKTKKKKPPCCQPSLTSYLLGVVFYVKFCLSGEFLFENGNKKKCFSGFLVARFQGGKKKKAKKKKPLENQQVFVLSSSWVANNIQGCFFPFCFFQLFVCSHICFIHLIDHHHLSYITALAHTK